MTADEMFENLGVFPDPAQEKDDDWLDYVTFRERKFVVSFNKRTHETEFGDGMIFTEDLVRAIACRWKELGWK